MVAAASTREVVFLLKAPVDPQAAAGFRQIAQLARTAQAEIQKGQKETADQDAKLRRERIRDFEKEQSEVNKIRKAAAAEESKDQKEALRAAAAAQAERLRISKEAAAEEEQDRRESLRAGTAAEKERQRMAEETATAQVLAAKTAEKQKQLAVKQTEQVERESQRASEAFNKSLISLAASRNGILLGAMHVARGVALLMSSNEKEAHKLLEKMMMIQGAYDVMGGSIHTVDGLVNAWKAYGESVKKAAAEQVALAAAQAATTGGGAASGAGAVSGATGAAGVGIGLSGLSVMAGLALAVEAVTITAAAVSIVTGEENFATKVGHEIGKAASSVVPEWIQNLGPINRAFYGPYKGEIESEKRTAEIEEQKAKQNKTWKHATAEGQWEAAEEGRLESHRIRERKTVPEAQAGVAAATAKAALAETEYTRTKGADFLGSALQAKATTDLMEKTKELAENLRNAATQEEKAGKATLEAEEKKVHAAEQSARKLEQIAESHAKRLIELEDQTHHALMAILLEKPKQRRHLTKALEDVEAGTATKRELREAIPHIAEGSGRRKKAEEALAKAEGFTPAMQDRFALISGHTELQQQEKTAKEKADKDAAKAQKDLADLEAKQAEMVKSIETTVDNILKLYDKADQRFEEVRHETEGRMRAMDNNAK